MHPGYSGLSNDGSQTFERKDFSSFLTQQQQRNYFFEIKKSQKKKKLLLLLLGTDILFSKKYYSVLNQSSIIILHPHRLHFGYLVFENCSASTSISFSNSACVNHVWKSCGLYI